MKTWTCQRVSAGVKCRHANPSRKRKCQACGKPKPARRPPAHRAVLDMAYAEWVELFGERCGICGAEPSTTRRLDRDHCHRTGKSRGLLCWACNKQLRGWMTPEWLRKAAAYLEATL